MNYLYEVVKYNKNLPAMVLMQDKPGYRCKTSLHWHKELEFIYMIKGHLDVYVNGQKSDLDDNGLFFCNSEEIHVTGVRDDNEHNRYIVVMLSYDFVKQFFPEIDSCVFDIYADEEAKSEIIASMLRLVELSEDSKIRYADIKKYEEILKICYQLVNSCSVSKKNAPLVKPPKNFTHAKRVIEYIGEHYADDITLNDMAQYAELSPAYFSKYFKDITGTSFTQYLNRIRLESAIKDMLIRNMSVTDAAYENGFPNVKSFITSCKKTYGYTPVQYCTHFPEA